MRAQSSTAPWLLAGSAMAAFAAAPACGAEWLVSPTVRVDTGYADNPRFFPEDGASSASAIGDLQMSLRRRSARTDFSLQPRLRSSRYHDDETLNGDYRYLDAVLSHRSERVDWLASAGYTHDRTLTSELESTGIVQANRTHESIRLSAGPTARLSERTSAGVQANWIDNHYADSGFSGLVDYEYGALTIFSSYDVSERSRATVTLRGGQLRVPARPTADQRDALLRLGWRYQLLTLWSLDVSAGPSSVESDFGREDGAAYAVDLRRQAERWSLSFSGSRDVTPSGRGALTRREELTVGFTRRLTENLSAGIVTRGIRNKDLLPEPGTSADEVEYGRLDLQLSWRFAEHWSLALGLSAATQRYLSADDSAQNNQASLGIVWNGQTQSL